MISARDFDRFDALVVFQEHFIRETGRAQGPILFSEELAKLYLFPRRSQREPTLAPWSCAQYTSVKNLASSIASPGGLKASQR